MKVQLTLVLLSLAFGSYSPANLSNDEPLKALNCKPYQCKPSNVAFDEGVCQEYVDNKYYLQACPPDQTSNYCPISSSTDAVTCTVPPDPTPSQSYPGEPCILDINCVIGTCDAGKCKGYQEGTLCQNQNQCDPGLACRHSNGSITYKCTSQIAVGSTGCSSEYDCVTNAACNITNGVGTCVPYFSVANGGQVSDCHEHHDLSDICASGYCLQNSNGGICSAGPTSVNRPPHECSVDAQCSALGSNGDVYQNTCECGYNDDAKAYCNVFAGDNVGQDYITALKNFLNSNALQKCNTARRWNVECWDLNAGNSKWLKFRQAMTYYQNFPKLINNDDCVTATWSAFYWHIHGLVLNLVGYVLLFGIIN